MGDKGPKMFVRNLKKGDEGDDVWFLQILLLAAGSNNRITAEGSFGNETELGVRNYQVALGIPATGRFDQATRDKMKSFYGLDVDEIPRLTFGRS